MSDFTILQLTDLHISKKYLEEQKVLFKKVIDYIITIKKNTNTFIILFTGDIIDKNSSCHECENVFVDFVEDICSCLVGKKIFYIFSGGNHDLETDGNTRHRNVLAYLKNIKSSVNEYIEKETKACEHKNENCFCKEFIDVEDRHKFFESIHYKKDNIIDNVKENLKQNKNCVLYGRTNDATNENSISKRIVNKTWQHLEVATKDVQCKTTYDDTKSNNEKFNIKDTYKKYIGLIKKIENKYTDVSDVKIIKFNNYIEGYYKQFEIAKDKNVGVFNLNTSWLSVKGDHLNYKNMYISDITKLKSYFKEINEDKNIFNILCLHHPLEYISNKCNDSLKFIKESLPKKDDNIELSGKLFNIAYCGHIHEYSDTLEDERLFQSLRDYFINIPGCLIPPQRQKKVGGIIQLENFNLNEMEELMFVKMTKKSDITPIFSKELKNIAFFSTEVSLNNKNYASIDNVRIILDKKKLSTF